MGFVDDDSNSEAEIDIMNPQTDEETNLAKSKESPLVNHRKSTCVSSLIDPRTPTTKNNDLLAITRLRRKGITESEEIWEELEDDTLAELSPFSRRKSSARSTLPSKSIFQGITMDENPDESTALLARSGTGRSYRNKRRRRSASVVEAAEREWRRRSVSSQEALGGWWKMKWWKGKEGKGKGTGTDDGDCA